MAQEKKTIVLSDGSRWQPAGGASRNYVNLDTGKKLSRRQFDKLSGRLGEFASYERKAKAAPAVLRQSRPARGRKARPKQSQGVDVSRLKPLAGHIARSIPIPFSVNVTDDENEFIGQALDYEQSYTETVASIIRNKKVLAVNLTIETTRGAFTAWNLTPPDELPNFEVLMETIYPKLYAGTRTYTISFRIRFKSSAFVPSKRKKKKLTVNKRK